MMCKCARRTPGETTAAVIAAPALAAQACLSISPRPLALAPNARHSLSLSSVETRNCTCPFPCNKTECWSPPEHGSRGRARLLDTPAVHPAWSVTTMTASHGRR
jgi:hypothetical protein